MKYGGRNCTIVVDCQMQGSTSRLTVYNSGQTVPEASRSMLFSPIRSMRPSENRRQGLGVGLSLSRDIIQDFGGDIGMRPKDTVPLLWCRYRRVEPSIQG